MHPLLEEFCRIPGVENCQSHVFNRLQREMKSIIQPMIDEHDALVEKVALLEEQMTLLQAPVDFPALPVKRGRGRPRKIRPETETVPV